MESLGSKGESETIIQDLELRVRICSPVLPSMDFLDLPGLVDNPPAQKAATIKLATDHLDKEQNQSMVLAVVPARDSLATSPALTMVKNRKMDAYTIGVLTNSDLSVSTRPQKVGMMAKLDNKHDRALEPYGYVTTSLKQVEPKDGENLLDALHTQKKQEIEFFAQSDSFFGRNLMEEGVGSSRMLMVKIGTMYRNFMTSGHVPNAITRLRAVRNDYVRKINNMGYPFVPPPGWTFESSVHDASCVSSVDKVAEAIHAVVVKLAADVISKARPMILKEARGRMNHLLEDDEESSDDTFTLTSVNVFEIQAHMRRLRKKFVDTLMPPQDGLVGWNAMVADIFNSENTFPCRLQRYPGVIQSCIKHFEKHHPKISRVDLYASLEKHASQLVSLPSNFCEYCDYSSDDESETQELSFQKKMVARALNSVVLDHFQLPADETTELYKIIRQCIRDEAETCADSRRSHLHTKAKIDNALAGLVLSIVGQVDEGTLSPTKGKVYNKATYVTMCYVRQINKKCHAIGDLILSDCEEIADWSPDEIQVATGHTREEITKSLCSVL